LTGLPESDAKRHRSGGGAAVLVVVLLTACSSGPTATAAVEDAVRSYSSAYLRGDGQAAYDMLSTRCQKIISLSRLRAASAGAATLYGQAQLISVAPIVDGDHARVTYRFNQPAIDQENQPWVREAGRWRYDKC
jgi:hypothetical protein